jgi:hypothetical protein
VRFWTFYMIGDYPWPAFANSNAPSAPATYGFALGYNATSPPPSGSALPAGATVRTACQYHHDRLQNCAHSSAPALVTGATRRSVQANRWSSLVALTVPPDKAWQAVSRYRGVAPAHECSER